MYDSDLNKAMNYDKIIIGAGLYGLYSALHCGQKGQHVLVLEYDPGPFRRATYINQARVHQGYHYPRSLSTARKSAGYFERFNRDYAFCINREFRQVYATSGTYSWTSGEQFQEFCRAAGIPCEELHPGRFFKPGMCDGAFLTREYTYDASILRDYFLEKLRELKNVELLFGSRIRAIHRLQDCYEVEVEENTAWNAASLSSPDLRRHPAAGGSTARETASLSSTRPDSWEAEAGESMTWETVFPAFPGPDCCAAGTERSTPWKTTSFVSQDPGGCETGAKNITVYRAPFLLNATYSSTNQILDLLGYEKFKIKYELCEIILCDVNETLKPYGFTVMDGPFFSIMPFGKTGLHSLTSVTFTPHTTSYDALPTFACQKMSLGGCSPGQMGNCNDCPARPSTAFPYMANLARKYLKDEYGFTYRESLFSMKPILMSSEIDDSRPTVVRVYTRRPTFVSVLSGKINTVYDLEEVLDDEG